MTASTFATACCLLAFLAVGSASVVSPVTRVVNLLKDLSKTIEKDGKAEEELYENYGCWAKSVLTEKEASNDAANRKIEKHTSYLDSLKAGKITLTTEVGDLTKDMSGLQAEVKEMDDAREKEKTDFDSASLEMTQAVSALDTALNVLDKATNSSKEGMFLAVRSHLTQGVVALAEQQTKLFQAVNLGDKFLGRADAHFLRRLLTGDVPERDWKKLNRKATFKAGYKARSTKIQETLKKMQATFTANLADAEEVEADAVASYNTLSGSKKSQLATVVEALESQTKENGARALKTAELEKEIASLTKQVEDDTLFITDTTASMKQKEAEWKARQELRNGELTAVSQAIDKLYNDDARDLMKTSLASQEGLFFLQESEGQQSSAASAIRRAGLKSGSSRLLALAALMQKGVLDGVVKKVDEMIQILKDDDDSDKKIKEDCEQGRMDDTADAGKASRAIDDTTDVIMALEQQINEISTEVASLEADKKAAESALAKATEIRAKENTEFQKSNMDDQEAADTVLEARNILSTFYKSNGLSLVQKSSQPAEEEVEQTSKTPPKTPETAEYGGKTAESSGIINMLDMVHTDILKDQSKAKASEDEAQASFDKFKQESDALIASLTKQIDEQNGLKGDKELESGEKGKARRAEKQDLDGLLKKIKDLNPNCEYYTANFGTRAKNRALELDGLMQARIILKGGELPGETDADSEIKPGESFLQRRN